LAGTAAELNMRWGPAVSALKKLWKSDKMAGTTGEPRSDLAWKINLVAMGLKSEFPELEGMDYDDFEED